MATVSNVVDMELAEKEKMRDKVDKDIKHGCYVFINTHISAVSWPVSHAWVVCACGCCVQGGRTGAEGEDEGLVGAGH